MKRRRPRPTAIGEAASEGREIPFLARFLLLLAVLFLFFVSISLMGGALKALTKSTVLQLLKQATEHPVVGLLMGILATSIIQSSSTTTSVVVGFTASGTLSLAAAIPMIMGANIGTTVTNTLVSFAQVRRHDAFERALAAGTVHDFFNILATAILFPLEISTHILQRSATWLEGHVIGASFGKVGGLKALIHPIVHQTMELLQVPWISLVLALILLFVSLTLMVKIMRSIFVKRMARTLDRVLFRNDGTAFFLGLIFTVLVQSSSVTTSLIVPIVGAGLLTVRQIFPYTLGANVGTTVTAFLAALAAASSVMLTGDASVDQAAMAAANAGVTVAIVHLLFNVFGILLIYPINFIPIWLATKLAKYMTVSRRRVVLFVFVYFGIYLAPLAILLLF